MGLLLQPKKEWGYYSEWLLSTEFVRQHLILQPEIELLFSVLAVWDQYSKIYFQDNGIAP